MQKKASLTDYFQLHFIVLIWGFTAILGKLLVPLDSSAVVLFRTLLAVLGMSVVLFVRRQSIQVSSTDRWRLLATGCLIGLHWVLFFLAARLSNVSVCLAGMATSSLWASVLEPLLLRRRVRLVEVALGAVVMAGLYLIFRFEFDKVIGLAVAVSSAMLSSLFTIINSRFTHKYDALVISFYEMAGALFSAVVLWLAVQQFDGSVGSGVQYIPQMPMQWLWLLVLSLVCTVYAYTVGVSLLRKFSPYLAILTVNLEPVYGILLAVLIFGDTEHMTSGFYIGTLVILLAVLTYPFFNRQKPATTTPTGGDLEIDLH
ncbi:DMT family transporter [Spirosoma fluviale]|uniref:EamA domain-containing membrane protein RarD n=1 Tax=Spirosoma fluviale TaxID=1597977 RepID=A0A286F8J8_9BACT|nr:DMT family transporter [Spirosoma fluviale]SOD79522.1 EamA domain-containing membrane protein RarD [Spirosoma fluviale]